MKIQENISLESYNTFGIDVKTRFLVEVLSEEEIFSFLSRKESFPLPFLFIGGGSNLLFTRDFKGTVIRISTKGISIVDQNSHQISIKASAGENWDDLVRFTVENGWGGLENLSLIPGSVGAAPVQNIGAYGVELKDHFLELEATNIQTLERKILSKEECKFGYRESIFKGELKGSFLILNVTFLLDKQPKLNTGYGPIRYELDSFGIADPTLMDVRETVCRIRQSKLPDPKETGNAGSFFKNPVVSKEKLFQLMKDFPSIIYFPFGDSFKLAAAWLIEQCNWKGKRIGDAGVHEKQPLVLVNYGSVSGVEIVDMAVKIIRSVDLKFGVQLEKEVNIIS